MSAEELDESVTRSQSGRLLIGAGLLLAIGSAGVLVLTDDLRWLRFGIIAALWAALVGAFIAAKYRARVTDRDSHTADLQSIYELELEREIAARREYELQLEQQIRAEAEEKSRQDVAALRDELRSLRQTLESLLGGEVLVERYALAQSTRMRPFEDGRQLRAAPLKRITAGGADAPEPVTERIERVRDEPRAPLPRRADRADRPAWPDPPRPAQPPPVRPAQPPPPTRPPVQPARPVERQPPPPPVERPTIVPPTRRAPEQPREPAARVVEPPRAAEPPWEVQEPARTAWEQRLFDHKPHPPVRASGDRGQAGGLPEESEVRNRRATEQSSGLGPHPGLGPEDSDRWFMPDTFASAPEPVSQARKPTEPIWTPSWERDAPSAEEPPGRHTTQPPAASEQPSSGGRRRRSDDGPAPRRHAMPEQAESGGRRRRTDDEPAWRPSGVNGSHAREDSGSHTSGPSVADLLAAHGNANPRRRRRRED
jgi:hypothetical protein